MIGVVALGAAMSMFYTIDYLIDKKRNRKDRIQKVDEAESNDKKENEMRLYYRFCCFYGWLFSVCG